MKVTKARRLRAMLAAGLLAGMAPVGTAQAYSPTNVTGLAIWLDAADVSNTGVNPANGTAVATWVNKAGAFNAAQNNASLRPTLVSGALNGLDVVRFTRPAANTARYLEFNNAAVATLLDRTNTALVVARANNGGGDGSTQQSMYLFARPGWHSGMTLRGYPTATSAGTGRWLGTKTVSIGLSLPYTQGTFEVITRTVGGNTTTAPSTLDLYLVYTNQPPTTNTTYALWNHSPDSNILRLGCAHTSGDYTGGLDGDIAEVLFYNRALSATERQELEGHLAWKWGLEDSLPSDHPYKGYPPGDPAVPVLQNQPVADVTTASATANGMLSETGVTACAVGVLWGEDPGDWANTNWFNKGEPDATWTNNTPFSTNLTGLTGEKVYYYTFVATNTAGRTEATPPVSFSTGAIAIEETDPDAREKGVSRTGMFTVTRTEAVTNFPVTVFYTIGGTAENGADYASLPGSVVIPAGETNATITVTPTGDAVHDPNETVILTLAPGAYAIGPPDSATVTIEDSPPGLVISAAAGDWNTDATWGAYGVPGGGDVVVMNHNITLSATTPVLAAFTNNATLTFNGWNTALKATTMTLGGTVTHLVNSDVNGTVGVYSSWTPDSRILIEGHDITVSGTINVDHKGYMGTSSSAAPRGPGAVTDGSHGAGHGGRGATANAYSLGGITYGSATAPTDPGSGAGTYAGGTGGNGGGAVRIAATGRVTVNGTITANGQRGSASWGGRGSGGSVYITCETFAGTGTVRADGGDHHGEQHAGAGGGRVAVVYNTTAQTAVSPQPTVTFSAKGGRGRESSRQYMGDPGTVHVSDTRFFPPANVVHGFVPVIDGFDSWSPESFTVNNTWVKLPDGITLSPTNTLTVSGSVGRLDVSSNALIRCANVNVTGGGHLWLTAAATNGVGPDYGVKLEVADTLTVASGSALYSASHAVNGGSPIFVARNVDVQSGGTISGDGLGFGPRRGPGSLTLLPIGRRACGGGHGGHGGQSNTYTDHGATYSSFEAPLLPGSGGDDGAYGNLPGAGGGLIRIEASKAVTVNGALTARGANAGSSHSGAGSGGAIFIQCGTIGGNGTLTVQGGNWTGESGNGGGGGRIAVWFREDLFGGATNAAAGAASVPSRTYNPQPGTVYWHQMPASGTMVLLR